LGEDLIVRPFHLACTIPVILATFLAPAAADRLDDVKARGKIVAGVSDTTPPFSFKKAGENINRGYDMDILQAVARRLGVSVEMVSLSDSHAATGQDRSCRHIHDANRGSIA